MQPPAFDPGEFRTQYRAFVHELIAIAHTVSALATSGARPQWAASLFDRPFDFPDELADDSRFDGVRARLQSIALRSAGDAHATIVAQEVLRDAFRAGTTTGAAASEGPSRGPTRGPTGWTTAKPPAPDDGPTPVGSAPPDDLLLSVPETQVAVASPTVERGKQEQHQNAERPTAPELPEARFLNAGILNQQRDEPLQLAKVYTLQIGVDLTRGGESGQLSSVQLPTAAFWFTPEQTAVDLTIQLRGDGFDVMPASQVLTVPRRGPSATRLDFAVIPRRAGRCTLTATVHKEGNYLLEMEISYSVGAQDALPPSQQSFGRPLGAAQVLKPREIGLGFKKVVNGYECTFRDVSFNTVTLQLTEVQLGDIVSTARKAMMSVVGHVNANNQRIFQTSIAIDDASRDYALETLARAGAMLFNRLFYGPLAGPDVKDIGDAIRSRALNPGRVLNVQIIADGFPIPWGMLYFGDTRAGSPLSWDNFLGMRHVIEQLPRQVDMHVEDETIISNAPALSVSVNVNSGIDAQMKSAFVATQVKEWEDRAVLLQGGLQVVTRMSKSDLLAALHAPSNDQLMYLYCHAITAGPNDPGGIYGSCLVLSNDERVTLEDLYAEAPTSVLLPGSPLVFLNACESAELTPAFYDGFVPYFLSKGARGVIGTECKTPALFATEFAKAFFPEFLAGKPLGPLFLELSRKFLDTYGNPLGLLYTVYCDGDTQIAPGLHS